MQDGCRAANLSSVMIEGESDGQWWIDFPGVRSAALPSRHYLSDVIVSPEIELVGFVPNALYRDIPDVD